MNQAAPSSPKGPRPLRAHSLAEAHFYLMVRTCGHCGAGPLLSAASHRQAGPREGFALVTIQTKCSRCREESWFLFEIPERQEAGSAGAHRRRINPTDEPSRILDVPQWVTLHQIVVNAADRVADKGEARELRCDAAECLAEALRFYEEDSDLPPPEALFSKRSRQRVKERPELYIRQALLAKCESLPSREAALQSPALPGRTDHCGADRPPGTSGRRRRRPWWRFWH